MSTPPVMTELLRQFTVKNSRQPAHIVVTPLALAALAIKRSLAPSWCGVPVVCREIKADEVTDFGEKSLGVCLTARGATGYLVGCGLKT